MRSTGKPAGQVEFVRMSANVLPVHLHDLRSFVYSRSLSLENSITLDRGSPKDLSPAASKMRVPG